MQWQVEWLNSLVWIGKTFLIVCVGFSFVVWLLSRLTGWGRQCRELAWPYFTPRRSWRPLAAVALILLLAVAAVRLSVLLSFWNNGFYDSLQSSNAQAFWFSMRLFSVLATVFVVRVLLSYYVAQSFDIHWRIWMTEKLTKDWVAGAAYYRAQFLESPGDNPDQRIQVDIGNFVSTTRQLAIGTVDAVVSLVEFTAILWGLSGPLDWAGLELPRAMVFLVYAYVLIASVVAFRLGAPLIRLNFMAEKLAADFRYALIRFRENAESIAFFRGEAVEQRGFSSRFAAVIGNTWSMIYTSLKFDGFNYVVSQLATVFPYLIQAGRFFSGAIKLGDVMQTGQAFGQVQDSLSFFRQSYDGFAQYRAVLDRLTGFMAANRQSRALPRIAIQERAQGLDIEGLQVRRPDGHVLVDGLSLRLDSGQALLVQGASGVGKTTLLRALAGLWPCTNGAVSSPVSPQALFLPQRPYLPLGSLRTALAYPLGSADDARMVEVLQKVQLGHLEGALGQGDARDWSSILSLGEQQRLSFARVLLSRPRLLYLDEATSAMDEGLEHAMYRLLRRELPDSVWVSVGHRSTLVALHSHLLTLQGTGTWQMAALGSEGRSAPVT